MELELLVAFERFPYSSKDSLRRAFCLLEVFRTPDGQIVAVATERMDNPGLSISASAHKVWAQVSRCFAGWGQLRYVERWAGGGSDLRLDEMIFVDGRPTRSLLFDDDLREALLAQSGQFDRITSY